MATADGGGYHQQHHHPMTLEEVRTLWIGDLQYWVDYNDLSSCFAHTGEDVTVSLAAQADPSQWNAYYGYGQGCDAYAQGATQDPSLYAYGAYAGYPQYAQQVEGVPDMAGALPTIEQREELYDPLVTPDVEKHCSLLLF